MRIALIDPEARHAALLNRLLFAGGHLCHAFESSADFFEWLATDTCDMLITGNWAGDHPAEEVIPRAQSILPGLPAIAVMQRARESEVVSCLHAGADDCVVRPVSGPELLARVNALSRRAGVRRPPNRARETFGEYAFDVIHSVVRLGDSVVALTPKEFRFAELLFANLSRPVSRAHILETVWARHRDMKSRTLDTHASRLRCKLQLLPERGYRLLPLYGYGYQLNRVPVEAPACAPPG
ncbi:response regulator transcription factor [Burkholderia vietnamiensis]|uniref:response regulator transcription factor n=1 Tax=Burkholderia vietnamiensis TaxID=60552 RepID=UPI001594E500|nr:response regulator transcription factor [Burkholderia vietnamiensis]MCA8195921.1 response regulator transcription factor [Burkholderia vietnamiensis]MDN8037846.1 response regulator transcription factor [Burkholderia vietnamiensis]QTK84932.1 response regulator transcription factor [Burkholderia vietnamiensis]